MTRRHEQITHRRQLSEIRNIMNSMKTLAIMETNKLTRFIENQSAMTKNIENMAADFLHFNPQVLPEVEPTSHIVLLVGSERGFCGDYNEQLVKQLESSFTDIIQSNTTLIAIGSKLHPLLKETNHKIIYIEGAGIVEDIFNVVDYVAKELVNYQQPASLYALHHNNQYNEIITETLLPPFKETNFEKENHTIPPLLNLVAKDFFLELTEYYLFNSIHRILYIALMIENQHRIQHLENATHHLDDKTEELKHKINALRQEEIIEEIEVILINASSS